MLACARLGVTHSVVFGGFSAEALKARIQDLDAHLVITADGGWRRAREVRLKDAADEAMADCPNVKDCVVVKRTGSEINMQIGRDHWWHELDANATEDCPAVPLDSEHPLYVLYTSGTTGFPKGALYTHKMLFWNSINTSVSLIVNSESRTLLFAPPFHTGGWNVLTTPFLHHGGYTCLLKKFDPAAVLDLLQSERCTLFFGVPTMLKMLADEPGFATAQFPHLQYAIVGGEPMPLPLIEIWHQKGVLIRQGYGMTEVGPNLTSLHQEDAMRKRGSIGRPNFYVETRIADEQGQPCPPDQPGELWLRGPMVTPGYWRNREATQKAFAPEGWFRSGDLVRQDAEHYLYVVDRIKNMYISGGENVYPAEIERILMAHPAVAEAAVTSVPDEKWGESGCAFVVKKKDAAIEAQALLDYCKEKLARYKVPKIVVFIDALPKSDTGKINRMALKNSAQTI
jgi:fatty-acyl-CoA synthase